MQEAQTTNINNLSDDAVVAAVPTYNNVARSQSAVPVYSIAGRQQVTPIVTAKEMAPYPIKGQQKFAYEDYFATAEVQADILDDEVSVQEDAAQEKTKVRIKGFSFSSAFVVLLAMATLAVLVIGQFVEMLAEYCALVDTTIGFAQVEVLIENITSGIIIDTANIIPLCVALIALFSVVTIIACLIKICRKGVCIFARITVFLALIASVGILAYAMITTLAVGLGLYIICGINFVQAVVAVCAKRYSYKA